MQSPYFLDKIQSFHHVPSFSIISPWFPYGFPRVFSWKLVRGGGGGPLGAFPAKLAAQLAELGGGGEARLSAEFLGGSGGYGGGSLWCWFLLGILMG